MVPAPVTKTRRRGASAAATRENVASPQYSHSGPAFAIGAILAISAKMVATNFPTGYNSAASVGIDTRELFPVRHHRTQCLPFLFKGFQMLYVKSLLACSLVIVMGLAAYGQDEEDRNENQKKLTQLKRDRVVAASRLWAATLSAYNAGTTTLDVLVSAAERRRDSELATAENGDEKLGFLREHLARVKQIRDKVKILFNQGQKGGEADKEALTEVVYLDAEIVILSELDD
jgi:hypothetical protein